MSIEISTRLPIYKCIYKIAYHELLYHTRNTLIKGTIFKIPNVRFVCEFNNMGIVKRWI